MIKLRRFFSFLWQQALFYLPTINFWLLAAALLAQVAHHTQLIGDFMDHRAVIEAHDNDAGEMIRVTEKTRWYNDNGFRYYTPLYFRLAHTLAALAPAHSGLYE